MTCDRCAELEREISYLSLQGGRAMDKVEDAEGRALYWKEQAAEEKRLALTANRWYLHELGLQRDVINGLRAERDKLQKKLSQLQRQAEQQRRHELRRRERAIRIRAGVYTDRLLGRSPYPRAGEGVRHWKLYLLKCTILDNWPMYGPNGPLP